MIVPTLCVGTHTATLPKRTQSVHGGIPTQSVGTITLSDQSDRAMISFMISLVPA